MRLQKLGIDWNWWMRAMVVGVLLSVAAGEPEAPTATTMPTTRKRRDPSRLAFVPRDLGAPETRGFGAARNQNGDAVPCVVMPLRIAYTLEGAPVLYWSISKPTASPVVLTITPGEEEVALIELELKDGVKEDKLQRLDLSKHGKTLKPGQEYTFTVTVKSSPSDRSGWPVASGMLKRIAASPELTGRLAETGGDKVSVLAQEGIFVDAFAAAMEEIAAEPECPTESRDVLLRAADLRLVNGHVEPMDKK